MTDAEELKTTLLLARNPDGGWPFRRGHSWTEPTALALLALQGNISSGETRSVAARWLAQQQRPDGGWPPCATVPLSTWVTSAAILALAHEGQYYQGCLRGALWLSSHVYPQANVFQGLLQSSLGLSPSHAPGSVSWFPGTAGWVIPTAFSILALSYWNRQLKDPAFASTIHCAQQYLLSRRCLDGGWNHGGAPQRSETSPSYAETTGLALLALADLPTTSLAATLQRAEYLLTCVESTEGFSWLLMGMAAHGIKTKAPLCPIRPKTTQDLALRLIALHALEGSNPLWPRAT